MSRFVLLDAGPLGLVIGPHSSAATVACQAWLEGLLSASVQVRRELLRAGKTRVSNVSMRCAYGSDIWR